MGSEGGTIVLVIGVLGIILAGLVWIAYIPSSANCKSEVVRLLRSEECAMADAMTSAGLVCLLLGVAFVILGAVLIATEKEKPKPQYVQFSCPRCQAPVNYQNSSYYCYNCGLPMDWSRVQQPRRYKF